MTTKVLKSGDGKTRQRSESRGRKYPGGRKKLEPGDPRAYPQFFRQTWSPTNARGGIPKGKNRGKTNQSPRCKVWEYPWGRVKLGVCGERVSSKENSRAEGTAIQKRKKKVDCLPGREKKGSGKKGNLAKGGKL